MGTRDQVEDGVQGLGVGENGALGVIGVLLYSLRVSLAFLILYQQQVRCFGTNLKLREVLFFFCCFGGLGFGGCTKTWIRK